MLTFQPRYILATELSKYNLPSTVELPSVMNFVDAASSIIDEYCGRLDAMGIGSLVYTTYTERLLTSQDRNIIQTMYKPLAGLDVTLQLALSGAETDPEANHLYTGFTPSPVIVGSVISPLISASGRYGYKRRDNQLSYPDLNYGANMLQVAAFFGGPPQWTAIDLSMADCDFRTGQIWVPVGLYLAQYSEILLQYNSGYDPRNMPSQIKHACAMLVRNMLSRGGGTMGMKSYSAQSIHAQFSDEAIDPTTARLLKPFVTVITY